MAVTLGSAVAYLTLDTSKFTSGFSKAKQAMKTFQDSSATTQDKFTAMGKGLSAVGSTLTKTVTAPLLGLGTVAIKSASDWETAWTGVTKTVDGTTQQMEELEKALFKISQRTASTPEEVAAVAEAAGQLGIQTENVAKFAETMIQLGDTTNLSAEEAATALARFANITDMSQSDFGRLGAVIVDLGNNFATTEAEITAMGLRLAGAGTQIGLTEPDIMGLSTALSSVGIEAEAGGTAFSKLMTDMQLSVETGNAKLNQFAEVAGMTSEQFVQAFQTDAIGAIEAFITGLGDSEEKGKSAIAVLDEMGITEARLRDTLLRAAGASDIFSDAIDTANSAWEENTALTNEANKRYETFESKLSQLKSTLKELAVSFGDLLLPALTNLIEKIRGVIDWLNSLDESQKKTIVTIAGVMAAIGPLLVIIGKVITIGTSIVSVVTKISGVVGKVIGLLGNDAGFLGLLAKLSGGISKVTGLLSGGLSTALSALTGPIGIVIAAVAALALAWKNDFGGIREKAQEVLDALSRIFDSIKNTIQTVLDTVSSIIQSALDLITNIWENDLAGLRTTIENWWANIEQIFSTFLDIIVDIFNIFADLFSGDWDSLWENVKTLFSDVWDLIKETFHTIIESLLDTVVQWGIDLVNKVIEMGIGLFEGAKEAFQKVKDGFTEVWNAIKAWFELAKEDPVTAIKSLFSPLLEAAKGAFQKIKDGFTEIWNSIKEWFEGVKEDPVGALEDIGGDLYDAAAGVFNQILAGFKSIWGSISAWVEEKVGWISRKVASMNKAIGSVGATVGVAAAGRVAGSFASGLDYVPREMNVKVHEGEAILTAQENRNRNRSSGGDVYNFYSPVALTPTKAAQTFKQAKKELALGYY